MKKKAASVILLAGLLSFLCLSTFAGAEKDGKKLKTILKKFNRAQENLESMKALFYQEKNISLLSKPSVSKGKFYYSAPHDFLWKYESPNLAYLKINKEMIISYYPELKIADKISIKHHRKKIARYLGIGQSLEELRERFEVYLLEDNEVENTYALKLLPKKERLKRR